MISTNDPWLPPGSTQTVGNNVDAYADIFSPDGFTTRDIRAVVSSPGVFDWAYNTDLIPNANQDQIKSAITQIFYDINILHDWFYDAGFDEASGNAQAANYGRGGLENDLLLAEVQDYFGRNNAQITIFPDGESPKMEMFIWDGVPDRGLTVHSPAAVAGSYEVGTAGFGLQSFNTTGDLALVDDGSGVLSDACTTPFVNQGAVSGRIALVDRGTCPFATKALNAQANGATGMVVVNNVDTGWFNMGAGSGVVIPCLSVPEPTGISSGPSSPPG